MDENAKNQIQELVGRIEQIESTLNSAKKILRKLESDYLKVDYTQVEGVVGKYDGKDLITEAGEKHEVPANYAAKSKLVYGDVLKLIEEDGKKLFKQIERVRKERVEGILTKKDGAWFLLTDRGSYKVSDSAAQFQNAQLNSQASAYLPEENMDAPFATLDVVEGASVIGSKPAIEKAPEKEDKKAKPVKKPDKKKEEDLKGFESKEIDLKEKPKKEVVVKKKQITERKAPERKAGERSTDPSRSRPSRPKHSRPRPSGPRPKTKPRAPVRKPEESREEAPKKRAVIEDDDLV